MDRAYTRADFVRLALTEFPALREEFADCDDLLHLQMHAFTRLAQQAKGREDWTTYARCMRVAHELWRRPDHELYNALNVSFLEHLDFDGTRGPAAWKLLTPELQTGWKTIRSYNDQLAALPQKQRGKRR
jgi:hypothetical protein